ncbi:glycoside hydrolase family 1 protein [Candidatus Entotheonella palauensis]|uniref:Beta-glucosidase n=1 Tax=Candidatus Entotheonella gemina TaxID=1429439 RepID=W4MFZ8_9BACT|nr:glycoside hydrolase family 1 protein [Candidatus Entotheonella palauensis]ETX08597.1 MAG: hypothetical protein ETSY2_04450 [Candidatus Entotheonella gemina]
MDLCKSSLYTALDPTPSACHGYAFPPGFLWGAATSSHQVEGHNRWNDWWAAEQAGALVHQSGEACSHYELYEQDFDMAQSWGHNAHRLSLEWSRIEPVEGAWNPEAVAHYRDVIRALKQRALEPVVTLHHFTNPAWFTRRGGWLRRDSIERFARYVEYVVQQLGPEVTYWLTINEPTVYVMQGYVNGEWPPFVRGAWGKAIQVCYHMARAHVLTYRLIHQHHANARVGFAHSAPWVMPCRAHKRWDRMTATLRDCMLNRAFFGLMGNRVHGRRTPAVHLDFLGINYYMRTLIRSAGWGLGRILGRACHESHHTDQGVLSDIDWEVYPAGLRAILNKFARLGVPLLITENGIATTDEPLRCEFLKRHLTTLAETIEHDRIPVLGYLYWSLVDNFEWSEGFRAHFGLAAVDYATQERVPRPCADLFAQVCRSNHLSNHQSTF